MEYIITEKAPAAIGPYSQAVQVGPWLFCSGQIGLNPTTGEMEQGLEAQMRRSLQNLREVLNAAGLTPAEIVKVTLYMADMADFGDVNKIYAEFFGAHKPARATVAVRALPREALVELDCIAYDGDQ